MQEWLQFYEVEPWGAEVEFLRTGVVASAVVNAAPNRKPGAKAAMPQDFMPRPHKETVKQQKQQLRAEFFGVFDRDSTGKKVP